MSRLPSTERRSVTNRHRPTLCGSTRTGHAGLSLVEVDDQHMTGIGLDVVVVGDLRRARVPDPAGGTDLHTRVLVAQRHIMHSAAGDGGLQCR